MRTTQFAVDEVQVNTELLPTISHKGILAKMGSPVEAASQLGQKVIRFDGMNGLANQFMYACETAYTKHYPLILSPDVIWSILVQGLGHHIGLHAEALRPMFVTHQGQMELKIFREADEWQNGSPENDWERLFSDFSDLIDSKVKADIRGWVTPDFTTTGRVERAAAQAALMAAMKPYFSYYMGYGCGFPRIELTGTVEDWEKMQEKVSRWAFPGDADFSWWTNTLKPIFEGFITAARGMADPEWWKNMMKVSRPYMSTAITGWINWLFPYRLKWDVTRPASFEMRGRGESMVSFEKNDTVGIIGKPISGGFAPREAWTGNLSLESSYPMSLSIAPITIENLMTREMYPMEILSGITSAQQDPETMAVTPQCGWAARDALKK